MLAWLLSRLPSIRAERDLAVARERIAQLEARLAAADAVGHRLVSERIALQAKFDRLVEARLLADGAIATRLTEPSKPATSAPSLFGNIGRLVHPTTHHRPADADDDSAPAGASMSS